ncbi:MAG: restriction endonuclease subunit S, partial [Synergistaceae bacterium]|nr:restriction endonuclease subunit S [Synergistaceae bacterium]
GYPLIAGAGDFGALFPNPGKFTDAPTKLSHDGDIILCIRATIGDRNWSDTSYCLGRGVAGLRAKNGKLFQGYLWHWLGHTAPELKAKGRGATFLQVSKSDIGSLQIPLPPIEEQKRIAAILDAADALRVKRRESIAQLDALLQSTFLDMFGDPVRNPKGWETVRFEEIGASRLGKMLDKGREKGSCQYTYLANFNVQWFHFDLENLRTMDFCNSDREEFNLQKGDLLVCEGGEVGRTAIWKGEQEDVFFQKALHRVRLDPEKAVAEYVQFFMWFMAKNGGFKDFTNSATIAHLTGVKLKTLPVPLPPLSLQRRFASIVEAAERQKARLRAHLDELDALFSSLQSRAFNGEL